MLVLLVALDCESYQSFSFRSLEVFCVSSLGCRFGVQGSNGGAVQGAV